MTIDNVQLIAEGGGNSIGHNYYSDILTNCAAYTHDIIANDSNIIL
jgi:hypothetical protein